MAPVVACGSQPRATGGSTSDATAGATVNPLQFDILDADVGDCAGPQPAGDPYGACGERGLHCIAFSGECCDCMAADLHSCGVAMAWACGDQLQRGCPPTPPPQGSP